MRERFPKLDRFVQSLWIVQSSLRNKRVQACGRYKHAVYALRVSLQRFLLVPLLNGKHLLPLCFRERKDAALEVSKLKVNNY